MKKIFAFIYIVSLQLCCFSQQNSINQPINNHRLFSNKDFNTFKERVYFGGNVGAWFGTSTYVNLSPLMGIQMSKEFSLGIGFTYNYYSQDYLGKKYISTIYGGNCYARYFVLDNLFAQVGWDKLSVLDYTSPIKDKRAWVDNILIGGGYKQSFSANGNFIAGIFYNINETPLSPYQNPIIQIGFNIGL